MAILGLEGVLQGDDTPASGRSVVLPSILKTFDEECLLAFSNHSRFESLRFSLKLYVTVHFMLSLLECQPVLYCFVFSEGEDLCSLHSHVGKELEIGKN